MEKLEIIDDIKSMMQETADSFRKAIAIYWPQTIGGTSDPPERNLTLGFSRSLLNRGYFVFGEASHPYREKARMDLLAISEDRHYFIVCEFKVYKKSSGMSKSSEDVDRIQDFALRPYKSVSVVGPKRVETVQMCTTRFGVIGGLLESSNSYPPELNSVAHKEFEKKIKMHGGQIEQPIKLHNFTSGPGSYWLMYVILPPQT